MSGYKKEYLRLIAALSSLGIEMGVSIAVGYLIGRYLDRFFDTGKTLTIIFILFGIVAGFRSLYFAAKKAQKDLQEDEIDDIHEKTDKDDDKNIKE